MSSDKIINQIILQALETPKYIWWSRFENEKIFAFAYDLDVMEHEYVFVIDKVIGINTIAFQLKDRHTNQIVSIVRSKFCELAEIKFVNDFTIVNIEHYFNECKTKLERPDLKLITNK